MKKRNTEEKPGEWRDEILEAIAEQLREESEELDALVEQLTMWERFEVPNPFD